MYGFTITKQGRKLLASLLTGEQLKITDVQVGSGKVPDDQDPRDLTALVAPFPVPHCYAVRSEEVRKNDRVSFIVEYRSDLNGGLDTGRYINEFGVYADDPEDGRVLLYYANLGDYPEWVFAFDPTQPPTIRRYPVEIGVSTDVEVVFDFDAGAFVTAGEVAGMVEQAVEEHGGTSEDRVEELIREHNADVNAHAEVLEHAVQDTFDHLVDDGTVVDKEKVQEMIDAAIAGGTYSGILNLTIPAADWTEAEEPVKGFKYVCDVAADGVRAKDWPCGGPALASEDVAQAAGVAGGCDTMDGYVRFYSKRIPAADIQATIALFTQDNGGIATEDTPGKVKPGGGLSVSPDGTITPDLGDSLVLDENGKIQVNTETVVTDDDMADDEEVRKRAHDIIVGDDTTETPEP